MSIKTHRVLQAVCTVAFVLVMQSLTDWKHWQWWALLVIYAVHGGVNYSEGLDKGWDRASESIRSMWSKA